MYLFELQAFEHVLRGSQYDDESRNIPEINGTASIDVRFGLEFTARKH